MGLDAPQFRKLVATRPHAGRGYFHLWPQKRVQIAVIKRGRVMRAQRAWGPVGPDHRAEIERVHLQLKRAAELYLPKFREWAIERKVRFQILTNFVHSELR